MSEAVKYCYVVVRDDLSLEQKVVQVGHVCLEAGRQNLVPLDETHPHFAVVTVKDENELINLHGELSELNSQVFLEPGVGYTAILFESLLKNQVPGQLKRLGLLKGS